MYLFTITLIFVFLLLYHRPTSHNITISPHTLSTFTISPFSRRPSSPSTPFLVLRPVSHVKMIRYHVISVASLFMVSIPISCPLTSHVHLVVSSSNIFYSKCHSVLVQCFSKLSTNQGLHQPASNFRRTFPQCSTEYILHSIVQTYPCFSC